MEANRLIGTIHLFKSSAALLITVGFVFVCIKSQPTKVGPSHTRPEIVIFFEEKKFEPYYYNVLEEEMASAFNSSILKPNVQWVHVVENTSIQLENEDATVISAAGCKFSRDLMEALRFTFENSTSSGLNMLIASESCSRPKLPANDPVLANFIVMPLYRLSSNVDQIFRDLQLTGQLDWSDMTIVFDERADPEFMDSVVHDTSKLFSFSNKLVSVQIHMIPSNEADVPRFAEHLFNAKSENRNREENFLFVCDPNSLLPLLIAAKTAEFLDLKSQFLVVWNRFATLEENELSALNELLQSYTTNIAIIRPDFSEHPGDALYKSHLQVFFRRLVRNAFEAVKVAMATNDKADVFELTEKEDGLGQINAIFNNITQMGFNFHMPLSGHPASSSSNIDYTWSLHSHLADEVSRSHRVKSSWWKLGHGFECLQNVSLFPYLTEGLQDMELTVLTYPSPPHQVVSPVDCVNASECTFSGITFQILDELREILKFRYTVVLHPNTSLDFWNVTTSMLQNKEVHIAAILLVITTERRKDVDFTIPYFVQPYTILSAQPKKIESMFTAFSVLKNEIWHATYLAMFLLACSMYFMQYINPQTSFQRNRKSAHNRRNRISFKTHCFTLFGILCQQAMVIWPTSNATRVALATWLLSSLIITSTYSGNIVAVVTFPKTEKHIKNLEDLVNANESVTWGSYSESTVRFHLNVANDERMRMIRKGVEWHKTMIDEAVWNRVINENHLIVDSRAIIEESLRNMGQHITKPETFVLGDEIFMDSAGMAVRKNFPFLPIINKGIHKLQSIGLLDKFSRDERLNEKKLGIGMMLSPERSKVIVTVSMKNFGGLFVVLLIGIIIVMVVFVFEIVIEKLRVHTSIDLTALVT